MKSRIQIIKSLVNMKQIKKKPKHAYFIAYMKIKSNSVA